MSDATRRQILASCYDTDGLTTQEQRRAEQLQQLYGFRFPRELFMIWRWYEKLTPAQAMTLGDVLGIGLVGPFDVLAGKFEGVDLAYPAVLHWRFRFDPPEFVTVMSGNTDRLHWGLWFDDHAKLAPVVAGYYANDSHEISLYGGTLFETINGEIASAREGIADNIEDDPDEADAYRADLKALDDLQSSLPPIEPRPPRTDVVDTTDRIGVVVPSGTDPAARAELLRGKQLFFDGKPEAWAVLEQAYRTLDRPILAAIARAHGQHPILPGVNILDYPRGTYHSLESALAVPESVVILQVVDAGLAELPDLSAMRNLEQLSIYGNRLTDLPATLAGCGNLREINLFRNPLQHVPKVLFDCRNLVTVILGDGVPATEIEALRTRHPKADIR